MAKVSGRAYGQRPKLTPASLDNRPRVAVVIRDAGAFKRHGERQTFVYWFSTEDPPDHILFCNGHDLRQLVEALGDETDGWKGRQVVVELVTRRYDGKEFEKYAVAPADQWDDVIRPLEHPPETVDW